MAKIQQIAGIRQTPKFDNPFSGINQYMIDRDKEDKLLERQELLDKRYEDNLKYQKEQDERANKLADKKEAERQAGIEAIKNYGTTVVKNRPQMYIDQTLEDTNADVVNQFNMYKKANPDKVGGFELSPKQNQMYDNIIEAQDGKEGLREMQYEVMDPTDYSNRVYDYVIGKTGDIQKATLAREQAYKQYAIPETKKDITLLNAQFDIAKDDFKNQQKLLEKLLKNDKSSGDPTSGSTKHDKFLDKKTKLYEDVDKQYSEWTATSGTIPPDEFRQFIIENKGGYSPSMFRYAMRVGDTGGENDEISSFSKGVNREKFMKALDEVKNDPSRMALNDSDASLTKEEYKTASEALREKILASGNQYVNALANASGKVAQPTDADEMLKIRSILNRGMDSEGNYVGYNPKTSGSDVANTNANKSQISASRVFDNNAPLINKGMSSPAGDNALQNAYNQNKEAFNKEYNSLSAEKQKIVDKYLKREEEKKNPETTVAASDEAKDVIIKAKEDKRFDAYIPKSGESFLTVVNSTKDGKGAKNNVKEYQSFIKNLSEEDMYNYFMKVPEKDRQLAIEMANKYNDEGIIPDTYDAVKDKLVGGLVDVGIMDGSIIAGKLQTAYGNLTSKKSDLNKPKTFEENMKGSLANSVISRMKKDQEFADKYSNVLRRISLGNDYDPNAHPWSTKKTNERLSKENQIKHDMEENKKLIDEFKKKRELGIPYTSDLESGAREQVEAIRSYANDDKTSQSDKVSEKLESIRSFVNDDKVDLTDNKARGNAIAKYMDPDKKYGVGPTLWDEWMMARDEASKKRAEERMIAQQDTIQKKRELAKKIEEMAKKENSGKILKNNRSNFQDMPSQFIRVK